MDKPKKDGLRTYGWYAFYHVMDMDGEEHVLENESHLNYDTNKTWNPNKGDAKIFADLGVFDQLITPENFIPLYDKVLKYFEGGGKMVNTQTEERLRWKLGEVLEDRHNKLDPRICEHVMDHQFDHLHSMYIDVISHPSCPTSRLEKVIKGPPSEMTKDTRGGEDSVFILNNPYLPSHLIDLIARSCKKKGTQNVVIDHPNVSRETLVFLSKEGKSDRVKANSLKTLVKKGWLKVK